MLAINVAKSTFIASFGIKSIIIAKKAKKARDSMDSSRVTSK